MGIGWLHRRDKKEEKTTSTQTKQTCYITKVGIESGENGGLYPLRSTTSKTAPYTVLEELSNAFGLQGFGYSDSIGLMIEANSLEDAKQKLTNQKNKSVSIEELNKIEEKWVKTAETELKEKIKESEKLQIELERYRIPREIKIKFVGKTAPEIVWGLKIDYVKAIKGLN
jgi:hypothetical protein